MDPLDKAVRQVLNESPEMLDVDKNMLAYWKMPHLNNMAQHLDSGEVIHNAPDHTITRIAGSPSDEFSHQYLKHTNNQGLLRANVKKFKSDNVLGKTGAYVSQLMKMTNNNESDSIKHIYDHMLDSHDYIATDSHQYPGGKHVWYNLIDSYAKVGHHLYVDDPSGLRATSPDDIKSNASEIWGVGGKFANTRILVSKIPLK